MFVFTHTWCATVKRLKSLILNTCSKMRYKFGVNISSEVMTLVPLNAWFKFVLLLLELFSESLKRQEFGLFVELWISQVMLQWL